MEILVQKFGGTSVGSVERIQHVADIIIAAKEAGKEVVAVASAMGHTTDELVRLATALSGRKYKREMDMLLTTGEQVSISLLSMAIQEKGYEAVSFTGWQAGIETDEIHGNARITNIHTGRMEEALAKGKIVLVAGFQGISTEKEITTLGRGGSDTTAVALAAALEATCCDIYTDVTGVYTTDPRIVPSARKLEQISYDEMLELAMAGAGVIHPRAVEFAKQYNVTLSVRSSMELVKGTLIGGEEMEKSLLVKGVAFEKNVAKVTVHGLSIAADSLSTIFSILARKGINVDIIIQNTLHDGTETLSFSIQADSLEDVQGILQQSFDRIEYEQELSKVSIVGSGMISNPGVAAKMFALLEENRIQIKMVSTSEIKVSTVVDTKDMQKAVQVLHDGFGLAGK